MAAAQKRRPRCESLVESVPRGPDVYRVCADHLCCVAPNNPARPASAHVTARAGARYKRVVRITYDYNGRRIRHTKGGYGNQSHSNQAYGSSSSNNNSRSRSNNQGSNRSRSRSPRRKAYRASSTQPWRSRSRSPRRQRPHSARPSRAGGAGAGRGGDGSTTRNVSPRRARSRPQSASYRSRGSGATGAGSAASAGVYSGGKYVYEAAGGQQQGEVILAEYVAEYGHPTLPASAYGECKRVANGSLLASY